MYMNFKQQNVLKHNVTIKNVSWNKIYFETFPNNVGIDIRLHAWSVWDNDL